jgi:PPK2 family polyphosphate:nucleotide phosphotransferase
MTGDRTLHRIKPGSKVDLAKIDPSDTSAAPGDKGATTKALAPLTQRLADLHAILWAAAEHRVLLVLQGIDTAGKGGTIEHVLDTVHPAGLRVVSFKAPSATELAHDYLWRVHANVPAAGELGVFDRSHYEDVLAVRVEQLVPEERWQRRFEHINGFEKMLTDEDTTIVKIFLHISKEEQGERLRARIKDPKKQWKFRQDDLETRSKWDDYQVAFAEAIERTSTKHAPWHVIPANQKWYRNWAVATILVGVFEELHLEWPRPKDDPSGIIIP